MKKRSRTPGRQQGEHESTSQDPVHLTINLIHNHVAYQQEHSEKLREVIFP